ncbi:class I SAM-dependent methyltransferase [Streptomyces phytophilus]|uniref:class I SAM-dependent methyltransferase n=1 Tax=Streptomyces phytophilus TaxID=722715 RepID=UPI0015F0AE7D|nr:methyltransferase domain-containing protein [Streptomyces phytophilus]
MSSVSPIRGKGDALSLYVDPGGIFTGTAGFYSARPGYPDVLLDHIAGLTGGVPGARVLDLGTGTGAVARELAARGLDVLAVDPCAEMLEEARRLAMASGHDSITWRKGIAEDLPTGLGPFTLAVIGDAFHWMNRGRVLRALHQLIEPGGCVALLSHRWPGYPKPAWTPVLEQVRSRHLGPNRHAGPTGQFSRSQAGHEDAFRDSEFGHLTRVTTDYTIDVRLDDLLRWQWSQVHSSVPLLGDGWAAYEADLRTLLRVWEPSEQFREVSQAHLLIGQRGGDR